METVVSSCVFEVSFFDISEPIAVVADSYIDAINKARISLRLHFLLHADYDVKSVVFISKCFI